MHPELVEHVRVIAPPRVITVREWATDPADEFDLIEVIRVEFSDGRPAEIYPGEIAAREIAAREFPAGAQIFAHGWGHSEHGLPCLAWFEDDAP